MEQLVEHRWTRFGKDRVYMRTTDGVEIGHIDLQTGELALAGVAFGPALHQCRLRWMNDRLSAPVSSW